MVVDGLDAAGLCGEMVLQQAEGCRTPGAEGVWAGILTPKAGRGRRFAHKQLRELAEINGFPARK